MSNVILYEKMVEQDAMRAVEKIGMTFAKSGMFGISTEAQGQIMAMTCIAEGITPVEFGKTYHVIEGKLSIRADAMQAKFQESGGRIKWIKSTAEECEAKFSHREYEPEGVLLKVTLAELIDSGVAVGKDGKTIKTNYAKFPRQMLRARIISEGVRMVNPSIVAGYYTPEEVSDFDAPASAPRRNARQSSVAPEPKEADAMVVDEAPASATTIDLSDIEDDANAYLEQLKWIQPGQSWRDLNGEQSKRIAKGMENFRARATQKETANA